jgi:hypothetical protein
MTKILKRIISLAFLLCSVILFGQNTTDIQYRFAPSIDYKINKKLKVAFNYRYDLYKDLDVFKSNLFEVSTKYEITKTIEIETGYRFTTSFLEDSHRIFLGVKYSYKLKDFKLSFASKYQFSTGSFDQDYMQYYKNPSNMFREKFSIEYNIPNSKMSLYLAPEVFLKYKNESIDFNRMRYTIGGDYKLKYGNSFGISVFYDDKVNPQKADRVVFSTKYNLSIDALIKKINKNKTKAKKKLL